MNRGIALEGGVGPSSHRMHWVVAGVMPSMDNVGCICIHINLDIYVGQPAHEGAVIEQAPQLGHLICGAHDGGIAAIEQLADELLVRLPGGAVGQGCLGLVHGRSDGQDGLAGRWLVQAVRGAAQPIWLLLMITRGIRRMS